MQVIFIHHSCFLVEVDDLVLIFGYFGGDRGTGAAATGRPLYAPCAMRDITQKKHRERNLL